MGVTTEEFAELVKALAHAVETTRPGNDYEAMATQLLPVINEIRDNERRRAIDKTIAKMDEAVEELHAEVFRLNDIIAARSGI